MTRIFWGVMGEGLGHVTRTLAVIEHLRGCEVHLFSSGRALAFLRDAGYPHTHRLEGLTFRYKGARVAKWASLGGAARFFLRSRVRNVRRILDETDRLRPALMVTDFEPSMPLAASQRAVPLLSVDNQHRFSHCSVPDLPLWLRWYAKLVGTYIRVALGQPREVIVSTFCPEYLQPTSRRVVLVPSIIRSAVAALTPTDEGFVLAYARGSIRDRLLACLEPLDRSCVVYGASPAASHENLRCKPLSPDFIRDLARCSCVVSTAGHQLISEAGYLGKPILAIPEPGQYEQYVNAFYLEKVNGGVQCDWRQLTPERVRRFVTSSEPRPRRIANGAAEVARVIQRQLQGAPRSGIVPVARKAYV